jgi:hypothetical protein
MSALSVQVPFPVFQGRDGQPLENGYVWIGEPNLNPQTNPVVAYFDAALTIPAPQPLRTLNGYVSRAGTPAQIYVDGVNFSILVQDSKGSMVYNFPDGTGISPDACGVTYDPPFAGGVPYPVCEKLAQTVSVKDFGAVGDGVADDTAAIQAAIATNQAVFFPAGTYLHTGISVGIANNRVELEGAGWAKTKLLCTTPGAHSIAIRNTGTAGQFYNFPVVRNLHIDGDDTNGCGIYGDGLVMYLFENLRITNQGSHGICLTDTGTPSGGSYLGVIRNVFSASNVGDGIYQVATKGADQQNASWISNCELQGNANGATIWGTSINITNSSLEGNLGYGLRIVTTNTGIAYPAQRLSLKDCYLEANTVGHIYVKTRVASGLIEGLSIEDNYFFTPSGGAGYVPILFDSGTNTNEIRGLSFKGNQFLFVVAPTVIANFGNALSNDCLIAPRFQFTGTPDFLTISTLTQYIGLGQAKFDYVKSQTLSGYFLSKGNLNIAYSGFEKSDNVTTNGNAKFPLSVPLNASLVQFSVPVETDSTNYAINFILFGKSLDGTAAHTQIFNVAIASNSGSKTVKTTILPAYNSNFRVTGARVDMYFQMSVTLTTPGTVFYLGNPTVFYVDA